MSSCMQTVTNNIAIAPITIRARKNTPIVEEVGSTGVSYIRQQKLSEQLSADTISIIEHSWREKTNKKYAVHIRQFEKFCNEQNENPLQATEETGKLVKLLVGRKARRFVNITTNHWWMKIIAWLYTTL